MTSIMSPAFITLPQPLHPAVVHFPIVLILLGSTVAMAAVFTRRWSLPAIAAILLGLGALGSAIAVQTGENEDERIQETPTIERSLEEHEEWAERTQAVALAAAVLAVGAALTSRWPGPSKALSLVTAIAALVATGCVVRTAHFGGELVYRHGAGVAKMRDGGPDGNTPATGVAAPKHRGERDDD